jgi:hypothetical protein
MNQVNEDPGTTEERYYQRRHAVLIVPTVRHTLVLFWMANFVRVRESV